jgi:hypothetical protein
MLYLSLLKLLTAGRPVALQHRLYANGYRDRQGVLLHRNKINPYIQQGPSQTHLNVRKSMGIRPSPLRPVPQFGFLIL